MFRNKSVPKAIAEIKGNRDYPDLRGEVRFFEKNGMVLVIADIKGLPKTNRSGFFAFHIHEGERCGGDGFSETGGHYNPDVKPHPMHAGDLPPLLSADGIGYLAVLTDRFSVKDIIGRTVVIHKNADDFVTQPAGNAGEKIACGRIISNE